MKTGSNTAIKMPLSAELAVLDEFILAVWRDPSSQYDKFNYHIPFTCCYYCKLIYQLRS
jgi:hypothetical protein